MKICVRKGDLTLFPGDAIVNASNTGLWLGSGVSGAISRRGGPQVEEEMNAHAKKLPDGKLPVGQAVVTGPGNLPCKHIIHAAVVGGGPVTEAIVRASVSNSLILAGQSGCRSVAFPALGTGVGGFSLAECARIMSEEVMTFAERHRFPDEVWLYLYDGTAYQTFKDTLEEMGLPFEDHR